MARARCLRGSCGEPEGFSLSADGESNQSIARALKVSTASVTYWQKRFGTDRLAGLHDLPKAGRPRTHDDDRIADLLNKVLRQRPKQATHWSVRGVAAETGISKSTIQRYFDLFGLQPHRSKSFKLSNDAFFIEKVRDIVGLYLNPPGKALVLCIDEKSQVQALERTQPMLPMGLGYLEGVTHDYYRHGTTTLFAALDVKSGEVITQCKPRHRHQEFLSFLRHLDASVPGGTRVAPDHRQLRHPQTSQSSRVARGPSPLPRTLHADLFLLAKSSRALVRPHHPTNRFGVAPFAASKSSYKKSTRSLRTTIFTHVPSNGPLLLTPFSPSLKDFPKLSAGQDTRAVQIKVIATSRFGNLKFRSTVILSRAKDPREMTYLC